MGRLKLFSDDFLDTCRSVTSQYEDVCGRWSQAGQLNHMHDEISEISDTLRNKNKKYGEFNSKEYQIKLLDEIADYFLVGMPLLNMLDITNDELNTAIENKLKIVSERVMNLRSKQRSPKEVEQE